MFVNMRRAIAAAPVDLTTNSLTLLFPVSLSNLLRSLHICVLPFKNVERGSFPEHIDTTQAFIILFFDFFFRKTSCTCQHKFLSKEEKKRKLDKTHSKTNHLKIYKMAAEKCRKNEKWNLLQGRWIEKKRKKEKNDVATMLRTFGEVHVSRREG